ncbi:hypothetical protein TSOC_002742 [Tetrabaena socialis]|uniref:Uncharacterized protein n=1 Tax=Tetrabaena socialis TaxID=47790 RepID=A0A2J8ADB7_9CHLO|nr:hypothetical protein TSOC_002742 [Tetrabaena socialis]|eukprot:PNH10518.1 hypothetical protein TSOC_002742 [Tetrabaena socialis]
MVIDLDEACCFMDIGKDNAVRVLHRNFEDGVHFHVTKGEAGLNMDRILMTTYTFKEMCMLSNTTKGKEVRTYYIRMEKVLKAFMKEQLAQANVVMNESRLLIEESKKEAEEATALAAAKEEELAHYKAKTYEEAYKGDKIYISKEMAELHSNRHKIGKAVDTKKRESSLNTGSAQGTKIIYKRETLNAKIIKDIAAVVLKRYQWRLEHYSCSLEHTVDILDIVTTIVDTLASSYEHISRDNLFDSVTANLQTVRTEKVRI